MNNKIEYLILENKAEIRNSKNKLKSRMESLKRDLEVELDKINNENYKPSNSLGIVGETGVMIDVLISEIAALTEVQDKLLNIEEEM